MNKKIWIYCWIFLGLYQVALAQNVPISLGTNKSLHERLTKAGLAKSSSVDLAISDKKSLTGTINFKKADGNESILQGAISGAKDASFILKTNAKSVEGHIIDKGKKKAYKYFSEGGNAFVQEVDINTLICIEYENVPTAKSLAAPKEVKSISQAQLNLQSLPGAAGCVMLDFDGYYMAAGNYWNNGQPINAAHSNMSDADIQEHWELVAEDYRPFNLNITTNEGVFNSYPRNRRMRVVITPTNTAAPGAGGVAYIGSFNWDNDVPCWVFMTSGKAGGDASSHEIGHTFDLGHDGRTNQDEYFVGIDGTAWAPIMGAGYYRPIVQWSKGEYNNANNLQDDVATIASGKFGLGYRGDDYADNTAGATKLDTDGGGGIFQKYGVIASEQDYDFFTFTTGGGNVTINANTVGRHANLHLLMRLYNESGQEIGTYWNGDPFATNASMNVSLGAGKYFVGVDGNGAGDRGYGGYSSYGSIGSYWITGNIPPGGGVNPSTGLVTTYKDLNYTGFSGGFSVGDYNLGALRNLGVDDNSITSLKVSEGYKAILYFDDNFTGQSIEITADNGFVGNFNDQVTSLRIRPNGNKNLAGTYFVKNGMSGLYMDVSGAGVSNGDAIMQGVLNRNANQQFQLLHNGDGAYRVVAAHSGKAMDVSGISQAEGANMVQWDYVGGQNQQFILVDAGNGLHKMIAMHSGKVVEVSTNNNGEQLHQWWNANQLNSKWQLVPLPKSTTGLVTTYLDINYTGFSGGFSIGDYNLDALRALGVEDNSITSLKVTEGYKAILYFDNNFSGQSVEITADNAFVGNFNDQVTSLRVVANGVKTVAGTYFLQNRHSGLNMDVSGAATIDGANIMQGTANGGTNQQFKLTHLGDGVYQVIAVHSGKGLDVDAGKKDNGTNVQQWGYLANSHQQFIVVATDLAACYKLIAKHSGKMVEVAGASTANGANVQQWDNNNQTCGQWKFNLVTPPVDGNGDGLTGNYFDGMNFETPVFTRKDVVINADWGNGSPNPAVKSDLFSARWTGQIQPRYSGEYTFYLNSDNGRRLWINNTLLVDKWVDDWGTEYSGKITLAAGKKYDIRLEYFENVGGANIKFEWSSDAQAREVVPQSQLYSNALPTVSISSPASNGTFTAPATISLTATSADNISLAKVEYYNGTTKLGEATGAPYAFNWANVAAGTYTITARATDNQGGVAVSTSVSVTVNTVIGTNVAPTVSLTAPTNNQNYTSPASVTISANAADADGSISKVEFYNGATKLGEDLTSPYSFVWTNVGAGTYTISAKATDDQAASTTSTSVSIRVVAPNQAPTVSLTAPTNGQSYNAPATVAISANAADADGTVSKVEFYNGGTKLGEDASAPYSFSWTNVAAGTYSITARALDNSGASATSSAVSITVKTVVTDACASVAQYAENNGYAAGSIVKNAGRKYECKEWPYSGWCNGASWAYGPGTGAYWADAWYDRGSCSTAKVASDATLASQVSVSPNPTSENIQIQLPGNGTVSVYNSRGEQVIAERELTSDNISLAHLPSGMYLVKMDIGTEVITKLIVKQ